MKGNKIVKGTVLAAVAAVTCAVCVTGKANDAKNSTSKTAESSVVTNENGLIVRTFMETSTSTNGSLVTEHRRETRTSLDASGNILETSTSEYAQSYPVGDTGMTPQTARAGVSENTVPAASVDSFMGLKFGAVFTGNTNFVQDADEPVFLRTTFKPAKGLADFDDYYVYVTPKTHRIAKVFACAKNEVEPGVRGRRHYLIQALEARYGTWARLCSWRRPCYAFDIGPNRFVTACLAGSSADYETVVAAWDGALEQEAANEHAALREAARKAAESKRAIKVKDAATAF